MEQSFEPGKSIDEVTERFGVLYLLLGVGAGGFMLFIVFLGAAV